MAARRLILAMLVLLVLSTVLATLVPVDRDGVGDDTSSTTTTTEPESPAIAAGELVRRSIAADDPTPERIELERGDQLELTVTSSKLADQVEIPAFSGLENVNPDFPARFDLLALETGSFPVRLSEAERVIARIEVGAGAEPGKARGDQAGGDGGGATTAARAIPPARASPAPLRARAR